MSKLGLPILTEINNSQAWMPVKTGVANHTSSFMMGRLVQRQLTNGTHNTNINLQKKFIGGNRDSSSITAKKTAIAIGKNTRNQNLTTFVENDSVSKKEIYTALNRVRRTNNVVPNKVYNKYLL